MANIKAVQSGNWSSSSTWDNGIFPTSSDDVYANGFTVTIDTNINVLSLRTTSASLITAGGGFTVSSNGITVTAANVIAGGSTCLIFTITAGQTANLIGSSTGSNTVSSSPGVLFSGTGTLNVNGNSKAGAASNSHGIRVSGTGTINITGNLEGSIGDGGGLRSETNCTVTVTGNITSGEFASGIFLSGACQFTHSGTATATNYVPAISSSNISATVILSGPFIVSGNGTLAVYCPNWKWQNTSPPSTYYQIRSANLSTIRPLYTADYISSLPSTSNVRRGTIYGPSSELTGTMDVPPAGSVLFGVPVDNTTGTSAASATFWNHPISGITTAGSIGERLKTAATVNTVSKQISDAFSGPYI